MPVRVFTWLSSFWILAGLNFSAQTPIFKNYTVRDGLITDNVYNLLQDQQGYIWIFTEHGALKYNSNTFKPVLKNLPYKESFIYCIYENKLGKKWVANSNAKIFEIRRDSAFIVKGTEHISEFLRKQAEEIYMLYADENSNIYVITKNKSYEFVCRNNLYTSIDLSKQIKDTSYTYQILERGNSLLPVRLPVPRLMDGGLVNYFASHTSYKLSLQDGNKTRTFKLQNTNSPVGPRYFKRYGSDIYFSLFDQLGKLNSKNQLSFIPVHAIISNFVKDKNNHLWLACHKGGLVELNENDSVLHSYLPNVTINDVILDSQNGLWASSTASGLFYCKNLSNTQFSQGSLLNSPIRLLKKIGDTLFIGNQEGDLFYLIGKRAYHIKKTVPIDSPIDIEAFDSGYLISSQFKLEHLDLRDSVRVKTRIVSDQINNARKILITGPDQGLYVNRNLIGYFNRAGLKKTFKVDQKAFSFGLRAGKLLIATDNGVFELNPKTFSAFLKASSHKSFEDETLIQPDYLLPTNNLIITKIDRDHQGNFWFCSTGGGLFELDRENHMRHFSMKNNLPSDIIYSIDFSSDSIILLSTNRGLYLSRPVLGDFAERRWENIYQEETKQAVFFENKIYAGTQNGLITLNYQNANPTRIYFNLAQIQAHSNEINPADLDHLRYDQNDLNFDFDLICFSGSREEARYILSGPLDDSGYMVNNRLQFKNLPPGNYSLSAFPLSKKNLQITLPFTIVPAFWQKKTFIFAMILFSALAIFFLIRKIILNFKRKEIRKLEAEKLISEYRLIALKAQINPHFMSNCLSAIQNLIYSGEIDQAGKYLANFSVFLRKILNYSDRHYVNLEEEIAVISLNVGLEQLRFKNNFIFNLEVEPDLPLQEILIPALITQPFIENAIWHGLLPLKERGPQLTVSIFREDAFVYLSISDNGVGRTKSAVPLDHQSKGTKLAADKIESINRMNKDQPYKLEIIDLLDDTGKATGTRVLIRLAPYVPEE